MSAKEELLSYITTLSAEQIEKAFNQLPQVISTILEQVQPVPQKENLQNQ